MFQHPGPFDILKSLKSIFNLVGILCRAVHDECLRNHVEHPLLFFSSTDKSCPENSDFVVFALPETFSCFSFCKDLKVLLELDEWAAAERDDGSGEGPLHSLDPTAIKSFSMPLQGIAK